MNRPARLLTGACVLLALVACAQSPAPVAPDSSASQPIAGPPAAASPAEAADSPIVADAPAVGTVNADSTAGSEGTPPFGAETARGPAEASAPSEVSTRTAAATPKPAMDASLPKAVVHKSPTCGCCSAWVGHLREHGFVVEVNDTDEMEPIKRRLGVPLGKGSCHTAEIGPLVIEGHVPAADIKRMLAARDGARGLVLPGMPAGSPGMELPDGSSETYTVERINADGSLSPYATHGGR